MNEQEKQRRVEKARELGLAMKDILDGQHADVIHMALGWIVASYGKVIDPVGFPKEVCRYAEDIMKHGKPVRVN